MRPKLLFLAHLLPWPLEGGGQIKSYHTLRQLAKRFDITLLAFHRWEDREDCVAALQPFCAGGVHTVPLKRSKGEDILALTRALLTGGSFLILRDAVPEMRRAVRDLLSSSDFAAVHVDHLQMMASLPEGGTPKIVLDQHNVEHLIPRRLAKTASPPSMRLIAAREWRYLRRFETAACARADLVLAVSEEDAHAFREMIGPDGADRVHVLPIGVDTEYFAPADRTPAAPPAILTVGTMYWPPNVDGVQWFCAEVLPLVRARIPEARFVIAGARPSRAVRRLEGPGVTVTGTLPDVRPLMRECGVFVAPLRSGSGMRVKILNAMAMGLPIVSTIVGAEGIRFRPDQDLLVVPSTPAAFAEAVVLVLTDPALRSSLAGAARELAVRCYSWDLVGEKLRAVYDALEGAA